MSESDPTIVDVRSASWGHILRDVNYFTARISGNPGKQKRRGTYLEALGARGEVTLTFGRYRLGHDQMCPSCEKPVPTSTEKMTDDAIATAVLMDAFSDSFDAAIIISGDSDLVPAVRAVRHAHPKKRILVAFPPKRVSKDLKKAASSVLHMNRTKIAAAQLPAEILKADGFVLKRPAEWRQYEPPTEESGATRYPPAEA